MATKKCMHAESKKAIYVTIEASLLLSRKFSKSLEDMGYQRNEYDWYVMNNKFNCKKFTILWHHEDLNMSHVDSNVVSGVPADIDAEYGIIAKMTITQEIHKYLGMTIYYSSLGKVILYVVEYIRKMIDKYQKTKKENQTRQLHTTFLMLQNMQPKRRRTFHTLWRSYCTC